jgi:hypothetical protein
MFLLPGETVRHRNTDVHIFFGKPIPHTTFDNTKTHQQWAQWVKEKTYQLAPGERIQINKRCRSIVNQFY